MHELYESSVDDVMSNKWCELRCCIVYRRGGCGYHYDKVRPAKAIRAADLVYL